MRRKERKLSEKRLLKLMEKLKTGDSFEREKVIEELVSRPSKDVVEKVRELLYTKDTPLRMAAVEILKKIGSKHIEGLASLLDDKDEDIRVYACEILGAIKDERVLPYLINKLKDESDNVRNIACISLGDLQDENAIDALLSVLNDNEWIQFSAIESLGKIGGPRIVEPLFNIFEKGEEEASLSACEVLIDQGDGQIIEKIIKVLKKWGRKKRGAYIKMLLEREDEEIFNLLKEKIGEELFEHLMFTIENEDKRSLKTLRLLANFKNIRACEAILGSLKMVDDEEEDEEFYAQGVEIFAGLSDVWKGRTEEMIDRDRGYVIPIVRACTMKGIRIKEDILLEKFRESSIEAKREIIKNAPYIIDGPGISIIKEALNDPDGHIKGDGVIAAGVMGLKALTEDITKIAMGDFFDVRRKAFETLLKFDGERCHELVETLVNSPSVEDRKLYLSVASKLDGGTNLPFIKKLLQDGEESVRKAAIGVMGAFLDDDRYMEIFKSILMDKNVPHEILKIIKDRRLIIFKERLIDIFMQSDELWTKYYALMALSSFEDPDLFDIFLKGLKDREDLIKIGSIKALADLNDKRAIPHIMPFVLDTNDDIRSEAEMAIERMENS
ncbi:MAG: HEAT repeat domain-containing protein [Syntrophorhabdaceae bacterium]|nr:HEAT repeat domain-containing protein [Syntrophorhabdaceae bacterium]